MGCDIHVMVEAKRNGNWFNVDDFRLNKYFGEDDERQYCVKPIFDDRNYELFSFLADVRNYGGNKSFGFDRGFPADAHQATKAEYDRWGVDAHTPGYCTLEELKSAVKEVGCVRQEGPVTIEEAERYRNTGEKPTGWTQGVGLVFGRGIAPKIAPKYQDRYEWLEWTDEVHCFDKLISALEERKRDVFWIFNDDEDDFTKDKDIRIVFWFDN